MNDIDLRGTWELYQAGKENDVIKAKIPGDTHSALIKAKKISNPYNDKNELDAQWIGKKEWVFSREFIINNDLLSKRSIFLHCESLDTYAEVFINDRSVGKSDNMFSRMRFEIKDLLIKGKNKIKINFRSAEKIAKKLSKTLPYEIPHTKYLVQSPDRNLSRKIQCHGGWDWGPCLMVSGIYKDIYIGSTNNIRIEYLYTNQKKVKDGQEIEVILEVLSLDSRETSIEVNISDVRKIVLTRLKKGNNKVSAKILLQKPKLWWPVGYGKQYLYDLSVKIDGKKITKKIGIREVELVRKNDKKGQSFFFRVNGKDIFCKGANWIPIDALPGLYTKERYEKLLTDTLDANMNMIRIWGGGEYESDDLYQFCDEKGLLIWQDYMFSCSLYPSSDDFLESVKKEVTHQTKRLKDHPSVIIFCGNNENLGALKWFPISLKYPDRYLSDYLRLYDEVIGKTFKKIAPDIAWWPSSPSGGEGDYTDCFHNDSKGDMHYWEVWHEGKTYKSYYDVVPRFCSEFGYQSFPSFQTVKSFSQKDQWDIHSPVMEHHQRSPNGNSIITESISKHFHYPKNFKSFLYISQVQQVLAIKTAVDFWRSQRPVCMGILYWQLNDNWPVVSWSSIEYSGKWKLLHYAAKKFFQPIYLSIFCRDNKMIEIWGINDTLEDCNGNLDIKIIDFSGKTIELKKMGAFLKKESSSSVISINKDKLPIDQKEIFVFIEFSSKKAHIENELFLADPKSCDLKNPIININVYKKGNNFIISLDTDSPTFYVSLDTKGIKGTFSDNCFTLIPKLKKRVSFCPEEDTDLDNFKKAISIFHLRDSYI